VWTGRALWLVGATSIASALSPAMAGRLRAVTSVLPDAAPTAASAATVMVGMAVIVLARGLRHRKRRAWQMAVVLTAAVTLLHLIKGLDVEEASLSAAVCALLVATGPAFTGQPDPRSWRRSGLTLLGSTALAGLVGLTVLFLDSDGKPRMASLPAATRDAAAGLAALSGAGGAGVSSAAPQTATLAMLVALVLVITTMSMLRPADGPHPVSPPEQDRLRGVLDREGHHDSLGYFALRRDKSVLFSPTGKAAVAYRVMGGVSLASGDPLGDPEAWPGAIDAWLAEARRFAWVPSVLGASQRGAEAYHRAGLDAFELGDEAVLDATRFTLDGRPMRAVRQAVNRVCRAGYRADVRPVAELTTDELDEVVSAAERWRHGAVERGFSMALGRLGDPQDTGCMVARARDAEGALVCVLHLVPWAADGLSLDLMRRSPDCDNGVVELLVADLMARAEGMGIRRVSLNFAVFRSVFERGGRVGAGPVLRLSYAVLLRASRVWQLESLYRANAKYQPEWRPRFLCFATAGDLPRVLLAALRAEAFLSVPHLFPRRKNAASEHGLPGWSGAPARRVITPDAGCHDAVTISARVLTRPAPAIRSRQVSKR
jgi:lysyl-tRNA synthetase class 2